MNHYETVTGFCPICEIQEEYQGTDAMIEHLEVWHKFSDIEAEDEAFAWADNILEAQADYRVESSTDDLRHFTEDYR